MNGYQEDRYTRNAVLISLRKQYTDQIDVKSALKRSFDKLEALQAEISRNNQIVLNKNKGKTEVKREALKDLADPAVEVAAALFSFALDNKNFDLQEIAKLNPSDFNKRVRDTELVNRLKNILSAAKQNSAELLGYEITAEKILLFEKNLNTYESSLGGRVTGENTVQVAHDRIEELLREINLLIITQLNKRMYVFKLSNPTIYNQYQLAKKITTTGVRHKKNKKSPPPDEPPKPPSDPQQ